MPKPLVFQDVMRELFENSNDNEEESDVSLAFSNPWMHPLVSPIPSKQMIVL
jgi:hypothetical protein